MLVDGRPKRLLLLLLFFSPISSPLTAARSDLLGKHIAPEVKQKLDETDRDLDDISRVREKRCLVVV